MFKLLLHVYSINHLFLHARNDNHLRVIEHPPNRIAYVGNFNKTEMQQVRNVLRLMQTQPFHNHNFVFPLGATVTSNIVKEDKSSFDATPLIPKKD